MDQGYFINNKGEEVSLLFPNRTTIFYEVFDNGEKVFSEVFKN